MNSAHAHDHDDHEHGHGHSHIGPGTDEGRLRLALFLTGGFMLAEAAGGFFSGSLALLADAGHMLSDTFSLALAYVALRIAGRPADHKRSYGYARAQVLAAFTNGVLLAVISLLILIEAVHRLLSPHTVMGGPMLAIAAAGLIVNLFVFRLLGRANAENLNIKGALWHVIGDLLGSVAAIAAAVVILMTGWMLADPILSVFVAGLIVAGAIPIVRESGHILLEGTPRGHSAGEVTETLMKELPEIADVHHVHIWSLGHDEPLITLHVVLRDGVDAHAGLELVQAKLKERFGLTHATIQVEEACADAHEDAHGIRAH
ncbi:MAG: cation diffusion facilitator family transporter [Alphaproteobacteria bacterium]